MYISNSRLLTNPRTRIQVEIMVSHLSARNLTASTSGKQKIQDPTGNEIKSKIISSCRSIKSI